MLVPALMKRSLAKCSELKQVNISAEGGSRTLTPLRIRALKALVSAIPPPQHGAPGGNRTPNLVVRTDLLYPLSYEGMGVIYQ